MAEQERLHQLNLERLAVLRADHGLKDKFIIGLDEFALHMFPEEKKRWVKKGAKKTNSAIKEDKRQFTGNIIHNAAGEVVLMHQIFEGKTDASLPALAVRSEHPDFLFSTSPNHWSNQDLKQKELKAIHDWKVKEYVKDGNSRAYAESAMIVVMLDCWPVNLSRATREYVKQHCPGMELMFIPAGGTGRYQINDTHLHYPFKGSVTFQAHSWYRESLTKLRKQGRAMGDYSRAVGLLSGMAILRNKSVG